MTAAVTLCSDLLALELPAEPVPLRRELRAALLDDATWDEWFGPELGVGELLWSAWGEALSAGGLMREQFALEVRRYRRELWFWVLGDRTWVQAATGLAGRLVRRLPRG